MLKDLKILIAEDNVLNQKIVSHNLLKSGANVTVAINGNEVIEEMNRGQYDLILMDLYMPLTDGFEATEYIRQTLNSKIPIIALSASNYEDEMKRCINIGMNACIVKPFDIEKLQKTLIKLGIFN